MSFVDILQNISPKQFHKVSVVFIIVGNPFSVVLYSYLDGADITINILVI